MRQPRVGNLKHGDRGISVPMISSVLSDRPRGTNDNGINSDVPARCYHFFPSLLNAASATASGVIPNCL